MTERTVNHSTFVIERSYPVNPERVFAALSDPAKKRRWYADEHGATTVESFDLDFRVGGAQHVAYRFKEGSPFPGASLANHAVITDIVPNRRIVEASTMSLDGRRFSASLITFELVPTDQGTDLILTHQGAFFEGADGPQMREQGWRKLIDNLTRELAA